MIKHLFTSPCHPLYARWLFFFFDTPSNALFTIKLWYFRCLWIILIIFIYFHFSHLTPHIFIIWSLNPHGILHPPSLPSRHYTHNVYFGLNRIKENYSTIFFRIHSTWYSVPHCCTCINKKRLKIGRKIILAISLNT